MDDDRQDAPDWFAVHTPEWDAVRNELGLPL